VLVVVVLLEIYKWCRDRNARCGGVAGKLQLVQGQSASCGGVAGNIQMVQGQEC
jgi:hypothetical protein